MLQCALRRLIPLAAAMVLAVPGSPAAIGSIGRPAPVLAGGPSGAAMRGSTLDQVDALEAGKLLVAARGLRDPSFAETVVLLVDHSADGAAGLVVNVRTDVPVARVFDRLNLGDGPSSLVHYGGPVAVDEALALVLSSEPLPGAQPVGDGVHLVATRELMEELLTGGAEPSRFRVYLGRAGWGPGQLDRETSLGAWHVFDVEAEAVFDPRPDGTWRRLIARTESMLVRNRVPGVIRESLGSSLCSGVS